MSEQFNSDANAVSKADAKADAKSDAKADVTVLDKTLWGVICAKDGVLDMKPTFRVLGLPPSLLFNEADICVMRLIFLHLINTPNLSVSAIERIHNASEWADWEGEKILLPKMDSVLGSAHSNFKRAMSGESRGKAGDLIPDLYSRTQCLDNLTLHIAREIKLFVSMLPSSNSKLITSKLNIDTPEWRRIWPCYRARIDRIRYMHAVQEILRNLHG
jgi:hypothetical protein